MYAEASYPALPGDKATLQSKIFPALRTGCLKFFYNMNGPTMGALRVFVVPENGGPERPVWEKIGSQGKGWKEGQVDYSSHFDYRVFTRFYYKNIKKEAFRCSYFFQF